jgi:hypothetical protein
MPFSQVTEETFWSYILRLSYTITIYAVSISEHYCLSSRLYRAKSQMSDNKNFRPEENF